jgi:CHAT domain-containing protein
MIAYRAGPLGLSLAIVLAAAASLGLGQGANAAAAPESFLLGTSARTGDICEALSDDNDIAAQRKGGHAWAVRCRGWNYDFGRLYAFTREGDAAVREGGVWAQGLARRATCQADRPTKIAGLSGATKRLCKTTRSGANYVVYRAKAVNALQPSVIVTAEGLAQVSDLLENGLKIAAGRSGKTVAASESGGENEAEEVDPTSRATSVLRMAYVDNQRWQFADAERGFRASALDEQAPLGARAEAYLNWALNASNTGRFKEADDRFQDAANLQASIHDQALDALALNYKAMHERNQLHFEESIKLAKQAIDLRASMGRNEARAEAKPGELRIDEALATAFNHGAQRETLQTLTDVQKGAVRDAQAWYIVASAQESLGQRDQALASLARAERIFDDQANTPGSEVLLSSTGWLRAQILAEGAQVDIAAGRGPEAVTAATAALGALRRQPELRGTATEAAFILTLAQAEALDKRTEQAMRDYGEGFKLFRDTRGSLGGSADAAEVYFDLLIQQARSDPAHAATYQSLYFEAMQSVVDATTADTMKRLFARISTGDSASAGLARSFEDTGRLLAIANGTIKTLQDEGKYTGAEKDRADAQAATLRTQQEKLQQQLLALNPHYNAIVRTAATISSLQDALKRDEIYVKFLILGDRSYGLAITKEKVVTYAIPLSAEEAAQTVRRLRVAVDTVDRLPRFDVSGAHELYVKLFGPVAGDVAASRHLIYEPDGVLISLPAEVLVTDKASADAFKQRVDLYRRGADIDLYQKTAWLGRKTDISLEVSAEGFIQSRKAARSQGAKAFLAFGDPITQGVTDPRLFSLLINPEQGRSKDLCEPERLEMGAALQRLKGAAEAIRDIGTELKASPDELVLGEAFTDNAVKARKDLDQYRVVFFGTHGLLPAAGDCLPEPALVTSLGSGESDALLGVSEIFNLKLDADLVVLSACDTGGGNSVSARTGVAGSGAALDGLARAFIYAGARNLVVTHWQIPETSNQLIMTKVFRPGSGNQAEALREAQLSLMDDKAFSHPFYWAAFSLVGDGARPFPGN